MTDKFDFASWLEETGYAANEYARDTGIGWNTVHRRKRGETGITKEHENLLRALLAYKRNGGDVKALIKQGQEI